jgi:general secretion pathway protein E
MSLLNDYIIDYDLINSFDIDSLISSNILPIKSFDFYTLIATSCDSDISYFKSKHLTPFKTINVSKNDINFYLDEINLRSKIYSLVDSCLDFNKNENYINSFFSLLLEFVIIKHGSDIHFESVDDAFIIRFRIDGILKQFFRFSLEFYDMVSSVIKLLCNLDITQKRLPMNGRFSYKIKDIQYDFRVSTMPIIYGESIVIRVLNKQNIQKNLDELGFDDICLDIIKEKVSYLQGMILVTGPTGSGKTTTLYSILKYLCSNSKKIITIEDPIEYKLDNISQIAINSDIGLSFSEILRNVLRQDPDVLMIGEIRDKESLNIAIRASLTGHLVLATLHTNDSISTINRLFDLDIEPFLIASTLKTIISQRLVPRLCDFCKTEIKNIQDIDGKNFINSGCIKCNYTSYNSREVLSEVFIVDDMISSMISKKTNSNEILNYCKTKSFETLLENGLKKVKKGLITIEDVYKVTHY